LRLCQTRLSRHRLRKFSTSNGCQDHTASPSAATSFVLHAVRPITGFIPPCDHIARPTLPRPPHPVPTFVTMANAPLGDRTARVLEVICPTAKAEYFCKRGWTDFSVICPSGNLVVPTALKSPLRATRSSPQSRTLMVRRRVRAVSGQRSTESCAENVCLSG
jgi:hypothetical protein